MILVGKVRCTHFRHNLAVGKVALHVAAREVGNLHRLAAIEEVHALAIGDRARESVGDDPSLVGLRQALPHAVAREIEEDLGQVVADHLLGELAIVSGPVGHACGNRRSGGVDHLRKFDGDLRQRHARVRLLGAHEELGLNTRKFAQALKHLTYIRVLDRKEFLVGKHHARADLVARADHAALVGRRILDDGHALLAQLLARARGQEEIRALGDDQRARLSVVG